MEVNKKCIVRGNLDFDTWIGVAQLCGYLKHQWHSLRNKCNIQFAAFLVIESWLVICFPSEFYLQHFISLSFETWYMSSILVECHCNQNSFNCCVDSLLLFLNDLLRFTGITLSYQSLIKISKRFKVTKEINEKF